MNPTVVAHLYAYTPQGIMEYRTTDFDKVYRFKKTCKKVGCQYSVRFRKVEPKENTDHIWNKIKSIIKR